MKITYDLTKPKGDNFRVADVSRLTSHGFQPIVSLEEGLKDTLDWFIANNPYEGRFDPFLSRDYTNLIEAC